MTLIITTATKQPTAAMTSAYPQIVRRRSPSRAFDPFVAVDDCALGSALGCTTGFTLYMRRFGVNAYTAPFGRGRTTTLSSGGRALSRNVRRNQHRGRPLLP